MSATQQINHDIQTQEIETPSGIISYLRHKSGITTPVPENKFFVSDLVGCKRRTYYKMIGIKEEELMEDATVENIWDKVRGDYLHQLTYAYKWREMDIEYHIAIRGNRTAILAGRLDMYDWKSKTIIDLKTTKFIRWQKKQRLLPKNDHIMQIQCYYTMFSQILPIEKLNIVYVDMSDIVTYDIQKRDLSDWIRKRIQELDDAKTGNTVPPGEVSGLCKYCKYQTRCYNDGNGMITGPLPLYKQPQ